MKVLFITTIPSPYRVDFFNELGKFCDLTVLFEKNSSDERDESWNDYKFVNFNGIFLKGIKVSVNTAFCPMVRKYLNNRWDYIICCNLSTPTGILEMYTLKKRKIPYCIEADGAVAKKKKKRTKRKGENIFNF